MSSKYDHVQNIRLNDAGMAKLKRVAQRNFLEPGTYARVVLLKHLAAQPDDDVLRPPKSKVTPLKRNEVAA